MRRWSVLSFLLISSNANVVWSSLATLSIIPYTTSTSHSIGIAIGQPTALKQKATV